MFQSPDNAESDGKRKQLTCLEISVSEEGTVPQL